MGAALSGGYSSQSSTDVLSQLINSIQQTNQSQQSNAQQEGTTQTAKTLTPYQSAVQGPLAQLISQGITDPSKLVAPQQNQAREQVNDNYSGLASKLRQQFLSTGGGSSGKFGTAMLQGDLARRGDLSNVDNQAAVTASAMPWTAAGLANQMLGLNFGQTTNVAGSSTGGTSGASTTTGTESKNSTETQDQSGWNIGGKVGTKGTF